VDHGGALWGQLKFNETPAGKLAPGMIERGEAGAISCGYRVDEWEITDKKSGAVVAPEDAHWSDADDPIFTGVRWTLLEASLVCVAADQLASVRSLLDDNKEIVKAAIARATARQRMHEREQARPIGRK